jgi:hypothetical protein
MPKQFHTNPAVINGSYVPTFFVSNGDFALFVQGFTSDDFADWQLMTAMLLSSGQPYMHSAQPFTAADLLGGDETLAMVAREARHVANLTWMIGNTQRACQGIPALRQGMTWTQS